MSRRKRDPYDIDPPSPPRLRPFRDTQRERNVEAHLVRQAERLGGRAIKLYRRKGWPDRLVILPGGKKAFVETKPLGGKPREAQQIAHDEIRAMGFDVYVADSRMAIDLALSIIHSGMPDRSEPALLREQGC